MLISKWGNWQRQQPRLRRPAKKKHISVETVCGVRGALKPRLKRGLHWYRYINAKTPVTFGGIIFHLIDQHFSSLPTTTPKKSPAHTHTAYHNSNCCSVVQITWYWILLWCWNCLANSVWCIRFDVLLLHSIGARESVCVVNQAWCRGFCIFENQWRCVFCSCFVCGARSYRTWDSIFLETISMINFKWNSREDFSRSIRKKTTKSRFNYSFFSYANYSTTICVIFLFKYCEINVTLQNRKWTHTLPSGRPPLPHPTPNHTH